MARKFKRQGLSPYRNSGLSNATGFNNPKNTTPSLSGSASAYDKPTLDFGSVNTANYSGLGNNVNTAGLDNVKQSMTTGIPELESTNKNINLAEQQFTGALSGQDQATQALTSGFAESQSAREGAMRGLQNQQMAQSGVGTSVQNVMRQQQDRALSAERQEGLSGLSQQVLNRADMAGQQLASLGLQQQGLEQQNIAMQNARNQWESEFGLNVEMSEQAIEQWASEFGLSVEQAKDMQDKWKSDLYTQQTGMQMTTDQFYDSLNLDKEKMAIAEKQWASEFGLQEAMSGEQLKQWAKEFGLSEAQMDLAVKQWEADKSFRDKQFNESVEQWNNSFGLERERFTEDLAQRAIENGWTERELLSNEALSDIQKEQILNAINKSKYETVITGYDFTGDLGALEDAYRNYMGADVDVPTFSQFVNEAWDIKEGKASGDLALYISNMGSVLYTNTDGTVKTFSDVWRGDQAFQNKIKEATAAQIGVDVDDLDTDRYWNTMINTYEQMIKSPTQIDRETALRDFRSSDYYVNTLDEEGRLNADNLFYELDFLAQTGGAKIVEMPDGSLGMADSSGNVIKTDNDYSDYGKTSNGQRYVVDTDGVTTTTLGGKTVKYERRGNDTYVDAGNSKWRKLDSGLDADKGYINQSNDIYGTLLDSDSSSAVTETVVKEDDPVQETIKVSQTDQTAQNKKEAEDRGITQYFDDTLQRMVTL